MATDSPSSESIISSVKDVTTISPVFDAADADLSFRSSDNVIFKIHSKNLDTHCGGFPPSEFKNEQGEHVLLTEDAQTLEKLFQFIYPRRQPELLGIKFDRLCKIAEAAEKYEVFGAMNICHTRMREKALEHPLYAFVHGYKHGYDDLVNRSAPFLSDIPFDKVMSGIPDGLVKPWVRMHSFYGADVIEVIIDHSSTQIQYHSNWRSKVIAAFTKDVDKFSNSSDSGGHYLTDQILCWALRDFLRASPQKYSKEAATAALRTSLEAQGYSRQNNNSGYYNGYNNPVVQFDNSIRLFERALDESLTGIPSFATFLSTFRP